MATPGVLKIVFILSFIVRPSRFEDNISFGKQVGTSSNQDATKWPASAAVDGDIRQDIDYCAHTRTPGHLIAWWRVNLGQPMTINHITIYYRDATRDRFAGYQIFVSNTTDLNNGILCYEDASKALTEVQIIKSHQCQYVAQFVTIYNYRNSPTRRYSWYSTWAILELCEVQVFGCPTGMYGAGNCNIPCPDDCYGGNCNAINGSCFYCFAGKYGDRCKQNCVSSCKDHICEKDSGICTDCNPGKHGDLCTKDCSRNCNNSMCYQNNGLCKACVSGKYGDVCDLDCSDNCKDACLKDSGNCTECVRGKQGLQCAEDCPTNCVACMQLDGRCTECVQGKYGTDCELNCHVNCKENFCTKDEGVCLDCIPGKHGTTCEINCTSNCKDRICKRLSGQCLECQNGFYGMDCTSECQTNCKRCQRNGGNCTECLDGLYGGNCSLACVNCALCAKETGECLSDCMSGYEGESCQMKTMTPEPGDATGTIVGVVVGLLLVASISVSGVVFVIRRRRLNSTKKDSFDDINRQEVSQTSQRNAGYVSDECPTEPSVDLDNVYINAGKVDKKAVGYTKAGKVDRKTDVYEDIYCNSDPDDIAICDLKSLVKSKMLNKAKAFEDDYKSLPSGDLHEHKVGMLPDNRSKNRFKSTFPYDHSRVILVKQDKDPHSDYINASYIDGVTESAEYIATQGPTDKTVDDLWRMIWQQESGKIVMLTNVLEGSKKKCAKYWPDEGEPISTKHFSIVLDRERVYAFYVIRDITLTEQKTKLVRQVHQFHYTKWPDHGTPDPNELVVFHRRVKHYATALTGKMVVHCSAGIGRTGTFIALDALLKYGKDSGVVDVMGYIKTMRKDRVNMVQTSDQYIALHNILIEAFDMQDTLIPKMKYHTALNSLSDDGPINQTKLWQEYQMSQAMKPTYTKVDFKTGLLHVNHNKNIDPNVLAVDKFRVYLTSSCSGRTDYINAVAVPSYTSRTGYIVTQTPVEDTVVDLLTMVMDHDCDTIVIIETDRIKWLPEEGKDNSIGTFTLKNIGGSSSLANVDLIDVAISNKSNKYAANVRVFRMTGWDRDVSVPPESSALLQLLELVDSRRKSNDSNTTVVMCRDGYTQSGLFCCISNARDQMKIDEEVDIFQISRQLLVRRPEIITSYDQYQYCYKVIKEYLDTTDVYMN